MSKLSNKFNGVKLVAYSPTLFKGIVEDLDYDGYLIINKDGNQVSLEEDVDIDRILSDVVIYADYQIINKKFKDLILVETWLYNESLKNEG